MQNLPTLQAMNDFIQLFVQHVGGVVHCDDKAGRAYLNLMPRLARSFPQGPCWWMEDHLQNNHFVHKNNIETGIMYQLLITRISTSGYNWNTLITSAKKLVNSTWILIAAH